MYKTLPRVFGVMIAVASLVSGCGKSESEKEKSPPPVAPADGEDAFALAGGSYQISEIHNLNDGCGKQLKAGDGTTFVLTNDGNANVTLEMCSSSDGKVLTGNVRGNQGTLDSPQHPKTQGAGTFIQECVVTISVSADNTLKGHYEETQSDRNAVMRQATTDVEQCTTGFDFTMQKV